MIKHENKRVISLLLISSLLIPASGCSGEKKELIAATQEYAEAVISRNTEDIASMTLDSKDLEEDITAYIESCSGNPDLQAVYDLISDSMTYTIDKKSIKIDEKTASVTVTFTLVDYMSIYEDMDDDDTPDSYYFALEDNMDDTMDITCTIKFKRSGDSWMVKDEDNGNLMEIYSFYEDISKINWYSFGAVTSEEFSDALVSALGIDRDDITYGDWGNYTSVDYNYNSTYYFYFYYYDTDIAVGQFSQRYEDFLYYLEAGEFAGDYRYYFNGETGYILFDGERNGFTERGGYYLADNTLVYVYTDNGSLTPRDEVDSVIEALGYPMI